MKSCAPSAVGTCPQLPTMRLHNGTADGQPHPAALGLGGKERRKDLIHFLRWQPHASVTDRELELTVLQLRLHRKLSALLPHGFDGVEHQVHEHLLQLHLIRHDFGQLGKFGAHGNRVSIGLTLQQREYFFDNFVYVNQLMLWSRFLVERTYTVDDFSRTIPILIDSGCCRTGPIQIGRFVCEPFYAAVGAGDGCSDGLLDFVCQRGGHFPQRAYTIDVRQVGLQLSQPVARLFGTLALGDIDHCAEHLNKLSSGTQNWMADAMNVFDCSIGLHDSELYVAIYFREERPFTRQLHLIAVFWVYSLQPLVEHWQALLWIKTEKSEHFVGPVHGLVACAINSTTTGVGQALRFHQIGFTGPKRFLGALAILDVGRDTVPL